MWDLDTINKMNKSCERCGQCCAVTEHKGIWKESKLTKDEFKKLKSFMDEKCDAFSIIEGIPTCRVELHFGRNAMPDRCKEYRCNKINKR